MTIVLPSSRLSARAGRGLLRRLRSRSPVGSSATISVGSAISARAIATRCCWPPDSSFGIVIHAVGQADERAVPFATRSRRSRRDERRQQQRQLDVLERGQHRHQVVELEDEADVRGAPRRELAVGELRDVDAGDAGSSPADGLSMPAMRLSSVDLPEPDGPISATKSPCAHVEIDVDQHRDDLAAAHVALRRGRGSPTSAAFRGASFMRATAAPLLRGDLHRASLTSDRRRT